MRHFVLYWALAGFAIPVAFVATFLLLSLSDSKTASEFSLLLGGLSYFLWPSRFFLMGMRGAPLSEIIPILSISIAINMGFYSLLGLIAWWVRTRL